MVARFTDAGAELMMKQQKREENPFVLDNGQAVMRYDAISISIQADIGAVVTFHWKRKAIYTMTASNYFGTLGDSLHLAGITGHMAIHHHN